MKRVIWSLVILCALAAAAPYLPAGLLRARVAAALERSLDRKVEIGGIRFTFFPAGPVPGPGFALENVTIHEDPRAGIEPLAYVRELGASVRLLSLLRGKLELSGISLGEASINLVKTAAGAWNFQFLLERAAQRQSPLPAVRMRAGRVNFKFGDTKSVFFFSDADLDISPSSDESMYLNFGGAPSRTDKTTRDYGRFYVRGNASSRNLDFQVEFERSSLEVLGIEGVLVTLDARISGPPADLNVTGNVQASESKGEVWRLAYSGTLDLPGERLELSSSFKPVAVQFKAWDLLKTPDWEVGANFEQIPLATLFETGRRLRLTGGATLPENLTVDGSVSGTAYYNQRNGLSGQLALTEASLTVPDREPVKASEARVTVIGTAVRLAPTVVHIGENQTAQIDGIVTLTEPRTIDLTINTKGLSVAAMQSFGLSAIPIIEQTPRGTWKGWARYREAGWSGESELRDARIQLDGFADPIEIESAAVSLRGRRVAVDKIKATAGATAFRGSYSFDPAAKRPHKVNIVVDEADAAELERLLAPVLLRGDGGFLARTLRFSPPAPPPWLKNRRAEGALRIDSLTAGPWKLTSLKTTLQWDGLHASLSGSGTNFAADLDVDLSGAAPKYQLKGSLMGVAYQEGQLQLAGSMDAEGNGAKLLESARGEVTVKGLANTPVPDADFRAGAGVFQLLPAATEPRWKLSITPEN